MKRSTPLLDLLCCPVSHEPLVPVSQQRLATLNQLIQRGEVQYVDHSVVDHPLKAALITRSGLVIYPIEDGIPVLLPDRGIGTTQLPETL